MAGPGLYAFVPTQFVRFAVTLRPQQIAGAVSRDDVRAFVFQLAQAGQIEVIHVGMGQQDQINTRKIGKIYGRVNNTFDTDGHRAHV